MSRAAVPAGCHVDSHGVSWDGRGGLQWRECRAAPAEILRPSRLFHGSRQQCSANARLSGNGRFVPGTNSSTPTCGLTRSPSEPPTLPAAYGGPRSKAGLTSLRTITGIETRPPASSSKSARGNALMPYPRTLSGPLRPSRARRPSPNRSLERISESGRRASNP